MLQQYQQLLAISAAGCSSLTPCSCAGAAQWCAATSGLRQGSVSGACISKRDSSALLLLQPDLVRHTLPALAILLCMGLCWI